MIHLRLFVQQNPLIVLLLFTVLAAIFATEAVRNCENIVCPEDDEPVCAKPIKGPGAPTTFMNSCLITVAECNNLNSEYKNL